MGIIAAIVLGVVQGLTEFLPVSSSGHLVLLQKVFGISEPALLFDTMLHVGTLLAVFVVLRRDILAILRRVIQPLTGWLVLATIPAVVAALAFETRIEAAFESGRFLGFSFLLTSAFLVIAELLSRNAGKFTGTFTNTSHRGTGAQRIIKKFSSPVPPCLSERKNEDEPCKMMTVVDAIVIGALQAVAIIPGVSRSGATISGALSRGLDRDFAARFSFLLSIPAILGALVFQLKDLLTADAANGIAISVNAGISPVAIAAGTAAAAIVGFFAMRLMLKIVREKSLFGFAIYTAVLGALVIVDQFGTRMVF